MKFACISSLALLFAAPFIRAETFDFTGTTVSSTLQVAGSTFGTFNSGPETIGDGDFAELGSQFVTADLDITFDVYDDTSPYLFSDHQGILLIGYTPADPESEPYVLQAGVSFVITFDFAAPSAQAIGDFEFVQSSVLSLDDFTSQFDAATSTLTLTTTQDIDIPVGPNLIEGHFLAAIPEPSDITLIAGAISLAAIAVRRRLQRK